MLHGIKDSFLFGINVLVMNLKTLKNSNLIDSNEIERKLKI